MVEQEGREVHLSQWRVAMKVGNLNYLITFEWVTGMIVSHTFMKVVLSTDHVGSHLAFYWLQRTESFRNVVLLSLWGARVELSAQGRFGESKRLLLLSGCKHIHGRGQGSFTFRMLLLYSFFFGAAAVSSHHIRSGGWVVMVNGWEDVRMGSGGLDMGFRGYLPNGRDDDEAGEDDVQNGKGSSAVSPINISYSCLVLTERATRTCIL